MKAKKFVGREKELALLTNLLDKKSASLIAVKGRRRIGKSRLIQEFAKKSRFISLSGIAPIEGMTAVKQRKAFAEQLVQTLHIPEPNSDNWTNLFYQLAEQTKTGRVIILLDEASWMAAHDDTFQVKLKNAWDQYFKKNPQLILALCSSISSWIEKNIISNTAFMGRLSLTLHLQELSLSQCNGFWGTHAEQISAYEKYKVLAVTGGVPRYLEEILPTERAEQTIQRLCFMQEGILANEFNHIFHDLFGARSQIYRKLTEALMAHPYATLEDIYAYLKMNKQSVITHYLEDLAQAGFIRRFYTWHIKTRKPAKLSHFRITDNYLRFYLKYIAPNAERIAKGDFDHIHLDDLPNWSTIMGLQFENLVINNRKTLLALLNINPAKIVYDNPYHQAKTQRTEACQIDYLIQDSHNIVYVIEIKFSTKKIGASVIDDMKRTIAKLKLPAEFSYRPVLIHVNGVEEAVERSGYFSKILDFGELL